MDTTQFIFAYVASALASVGLLLGLFMNIRALYGYSPLPGFGLLHGRNDRQLAIELLHKDVDRLNDNMVVIDAMGCDWLWQSVFSKLRKRIESGVKVTFFVCASEFDNPKNHEKNQKFREFLEEVGENVSIYRLPFKWPVNLRVIDRKHLYITYHGLDQDEEGVQKYWRSRSKGMPKRELREVERMLQRVYLAAS